MPPSYNLGAHEALQAIADGAGHAPNVAARIGLPLAVAALHIRVLHATGRVVYRLPDGWQVTDDGQQALADWDQEHGPVSSPASPRAATP